MKRFLLFAGENYYPQAGWANFWGDFDTQDQAVEAGKKTTQGMSVTSDQHDAWFQVVDTQTKHPVWNEGCPYNGFVCGFRGHEFTQ
jgi:hypothetical protein